MNDENAIAGLEDRELLRRYAEQAHGPAFDELVRRHLDHVYTAALRRVNGDNALAEDVAQTVFIELARKAKRIPAEMPPGGWLHRHTGFVASKMIDKERRRRHREQEAVSMNSLENQTNDADWASTAPLLDAAMDRLSNKDRDALVLRFFEQRDFRSVGKALGVSDDTAQKRVSRAVEKLRALLGKRGVTSTGSALAALMVANSVQAAPASLANRVSAKSLAGAATSGGTIGGAIASLETAARIKLAMATVAVATAAGFAGSQFSRPDVLPQANNANNDTQTEPVVQPELPAQPAAELAPEPARMDLRELINAAAAEWKGGREGVAASAKALGFLSQVDTKQMVQALEMANELTDRPAAALVKKYLLRHWAEKDPSEALGWAQVSEKGEHSHDLVDGMLNVWATSEPRALIAYSGKTAPGSMNRMPLSESVLGTIFRTTAAKDPALALSDLHLLKSPTQRSHGLRGILDTVTSDKKRQSVAELIEKIKSDEVRMQARRAMVEQWARNNAKAAAAYVEQAEPAWERTRLMDSLGMTWLQADPSTAADWWVAQAPGPDTLVKVINIWAQSDPNAAGKWLGRHDPGPVSDAARMTFARQVADLDPESALRWAETVSDATMRESTIDHVFAGWLVRDAKKADQFLQISGWSGERLSRLQNTSNKVMNN